MNGNGAGIFSSGGQFAASEMQMPETLTNSMD